MANRRPKTPKWLDDWNRLIGGHKYLMIRNWDEYQVLTTSGVPIQRVFISWQTVPQP